MTALPTAFPRGKRKSTSSKDAAAITSSSSSSSQPAKKRATSSSTTTTASSSKNGSVATTTEPDFLFGTTEALDLHQKSSSKQQQQRHTSKPHHLGYDLDSQHSSSSNHLHSSLSPAINSTLPLGGGSVLPSSTATTGGRRIPPKIEFLTFGKFATGTKVLGVLREVSEEYAARVLPAVNTIMAFYVVSTMTESVSKKQQRINASKQGPATTTTMKRRRIELSVLPGVVNKGLRVDDYLHSTSTTARGAAAEDNIPLVIRGRIVSVEDHGCIVDLGGAVSIFQIQATTTAATKDLLQYIEEQQQLKRESRQVHILLIIQQSTS